MRTRPVFTSYRPVVPAPDAPDADFVAYAEAWNQWVDDRRLAGVDDRIAVAAQESGHDAALLRAAALEA